MTRRLVKLIFSIIVWGYDQIKRFFFRLFGKAVPGTCVVLYYHMVEQKERQNFAWQLDGILRNAKVIRADTKNPLTPNTHHVAVTFDDGFVDILANAVPELYEEEYPLHNFCANGISWKISRMDQNRITATQIGKNYE